MRGRLLRDVLLLIGLAVLFTVPAKAFVAQAFLVPTGSMADTLRPGDRVLVNKLGYHLGGVHRGDIVVFSGTGSWGPAPAPKESSAADSLFPSTPGSSLPTASIMTRAAGSPPEST